LTSYNNIEFCCIIEPKGAQGRRKQSFCSLMRSDTTPTTTSYGALLTTTLPVVSSPSRLSRGYSPTTLPLLLLVSLLLLRVPPRWHNSAPAPKAAILVHTN
jgi:hypothetical protein